jgi:hypothetical protein
VPAVLAQQGDDAPAANPLAMAFIEARRDDFLNDLCADILGTKSGGMPTMADSDSKVSVAIADHMLARLRGAGFSPAVGVSLKGQEIGARFDEKLRTYVDAAFVNGVARLASSSTSRRDFHWGRTPA